MAGAGQVSQNAAALSVFFQVAPNHEQGRADAVSGEQVGQSGQTPTQDHMPDLVRRAAGQRMNAEVALDRIEIDGDRNDRRPTRRYRIRRQVPGNVV